MKIEHAERQSLKKEFKINCTHEVLRILSLIIVIIYFICYGMQ